MKTIHGVVKIKKDLDGDVLKLDKSIKTECIKTKNIKYIFLRNEYNRELFAGFKILIIQEMNGKQHRVNINAWSNDEIENILNCFIDNQQVKVLNLNQNDYLDTNPDNYDDEDDEKMDQYEKIGLIASAVIISLLIIVAVVINAIR